MESQGHQDDRAGTFRDLFESTDEHQAVLEGRPPSGPAPTNSGVLDIRQMARAYERHRTEQAADPVEIAVPPMSSARLGTVLPPLDDTRAPGLATPGVVALSLVLVVATACATVAIMVALGFRLAPAAGPATAAAFASDLPAPTAPVPAAVPERVPASVPLVHRDLDGVVEDASDPGAVAAAEQAVARPAPATTAPAASIAPPRSARPVAPARRAANDRPAVGPTPAAPTPFRTPRRRATADSEQAPPAPSRPSSSAAAPALGAAPAPAPATAAPSCDAVMCLVDPNAPCCKQQRHARGETPAATAAATDELPSKLSSRDVNAGIAGVRGRLLSCGDRHAFTGTVRLRLTIGPDGAVERSGVASGPDAFRDCVTGVAKKARFAQTQRGLTVYYPLVFR